ncbi:MAG TPA: hypothetical protein VNA69_00595 [Thermoanaerobaculia bacterium]|nr:hypothetical protein [Thermoanaerobaculia bacterium]
MIYRESDDDEYVLEDQIKKDLKYARDHLYNIKANIYGWDHDDDR